MLNSSNSNTTITVFFGSLVRNLRNQNPGLFSPSGLEPDSIDPCAPVSSPFTPDDLRIFARLSETLRAFEILALHTYLASAPGNREATANDILSHIPIPPINPTIADQYLAQYLELNDIVRSFGVVAFHHYLLPESDKELIAQKITESVESFYAQAVGLTIDGVVSNCDGLCVSGTKCVTCERDVDEG
jgi:hypothetical protein